MVDDLGAIDDRILERLPNIRSLFLQDGLQFNDAYSETPLCCPGRASFLTGQHTAHHGVTVNDARLLNPNNTIATALHDDGYYTVMDGKYLNGAAQLPDHTPPGWDHVTMLNDWSANDSSDWWVDDVPTTAGDYDRYIDQTATSLLAAAPSDKPVFMWVAPHAPHKSAESTQDWEPDIEPRYMNDPRCEGIKPWHPPNYLFAGEPNGYPLDDICRSMLTVDDIVGDLERTAADEGRNPIWMLTSDNGMAWGSNGYLLKNVPAADRLPFFMTGPGIVHGRTRGAHFEHRLWTRRSQISRARRCPRPTARASWRRSTAAAAAARQCSRTTPWAARQGRGTSTPGRGGACARRIGISSSGTACISTTRQADPWETDDVAPEHMDVVKQLAGIFHRTVALPTPTPSPCRHLRRRRRRLRALHWNRHQAQASRRATEPTATVGTATPGQRQRSHHRLPPREVRRPAPPPPPPAVVTTGGVGTAGAEHRHRTRGHHRRRRRRGRAASSRWCLRD